MYKHNGFNADPVDTKAQLSIWARIYRTLCLIAFICSASCLVRRHQFGNPLNSLLFWIIQPAHVQHQLNLVNQQGVLRVINSLTRYHIKNIDPCFSYGSQIWNVWRTRIFLILNLGGFTDSTNRSNFGLSKTKTFPFCLESSAASLQNMNLTVLTGPLL